MRNIDIFEQLYAPHTSRKIDGFDSAVNSGSCSIGLIKGQYRQLNAIVTDCATEDDNWRIVNLKGTYKKFNLNGPISLIPAFDSIAVLGAVSDDHASALAMMQYGRMFDAIEEDVIETNAQGLVRHLSTSHFHKNNQLIQRSQLTNLQDIPCALVPGWDGIELITHEGRTSHLLLDMQLHDDHDRLLSAFDGLSNLLESIGAEYADFDSIIVEYQYLDKLMNMLHKAMQTASKGGVKVLNVDQSEKPFRHKKVLNVAVSYDFEDGQTITILFHNPDRDAKRISAQDTLLSWKIMMNNRDVTGVIQPNQGEGIALPVLAGRIVKLINQNSARFKRTQAKKAENAKTLAETDQRIVEKQNQKSALATEIANLLEQIGLLKANDQQPIPDEGTVNKDPSTQDLNTKAVTKTEAKGVYDALSTRHRWLTGGTMEEFFNQNYPEGMLEALTDAKALIERPFGKVATANGLKESMERMIQTVETTISRWKDGPKDGAVKAKSFPPIEDLGDGYFKAYKNDKKLDDWTAHINSYGEWQVSANNASSRAWSNGFGAPRFFKTLDEMIAKYPAFGALPALLKEKEIEPENGANNDDADYLSKIIKGEVDFSNASEVEAHLEEIGNRLAPEINDLFEQAVSAYSVYQVNQAATVN
ncbi:hypothetical protein [Acinetobacter sp. Ac_5812]|uniref:defense against restriction DarA-related protein n=1 Tax=Acinetobacter sp. Ac_5812 TaxID=1848937 RepID=UPI00148F6346|nr:hypothetical protein [Acinetobacter sp. Ac_5812]NNP70378.1 hypothetical protein [Acinetobacter sp. Ac_5812]